ncbi:adenosylcobinamide-GDP ribazoletransferase [Immundisolibacter sp.]|uniref:adenosylcobinamide-GDP ribazoletransferase n=1 Tax=Immundisolibacter sp. TaxID=1934948 RepID=UPI0026368F32|nr:adenosylcobinamide-GDP ribazoletransferase [Immundisolibacter sp.]MDD3650238.1 adenosylcobinamide-GDP ribazoletransferase [Immundisolibacter sp.]
MIGKLWQPLRLALALLTTLPVPGGAPPAPDDLGRSPLTYPLVGLLLAILFIAASWALFDLPPLAAAALLLALWAALTGALHLDGLADCADALLGGHADATQRRTILRDPHLGSAAVVTVVLVLIGKFAGLAAVLEHGSLVPLLVAPVLARGAALALMCALPYASPGGMAETTIARLPRQAGWLVVGVIAVITLFLAPSALLIATALTALIGHGALRRQGGASGDVYGAAIELIETATLLILAAPATG